MWYLTLLNMLIYISLNVDDTFLLLMNRGLADQVTRSHLQVKDSVVCAEISVPVNEFKKFISEQKKIHEELTALSYGLLVSLKEELNTTSQSVFSTISSLRHTSTAITRLKADVLREEKSAGIAHKSSEHGAILQTESNELTNYFLKKISEFDTRMRLYKQELEVFEDNVHSQPLASMTPRDLLNVLNRMDHDFINLAAQLYTTHETMKTVKAQYLKKYKMYHGTNRSPFGDSSDVESRQKSGFPSLLARSSSCKMKSGFTSSSPYGPSPFNQNSDTSVTSTISGVDRLCATTAISTNSQFNVLTNTTAPVAGTFSFTSPAQPLTTSTLNKPAFGIGVTTTTQTGTVAFPVIGQSMNTSALKPLVPASTM